MRDKRVLRRDRPPSSVIAWVRLLVLVLAGCGRALEPAVQTTSPAAPDTVAEGTVRVVGPQETAQVVLSGPAGDVALIGPLAGELRRLVGARVRITGRPERNPAAAPERALNVAAYEIVAVDGERPHVGILVRRDDRLWLAGPDTLELVGAPADLAARVGAKVFITGVREGGRLQVKSYGVIRDAGR